MKILVLCTYPISDPKHGGQLRVSSMVDAYKSAGHEVEVVGVLGSPNYDPEVGFIPYPKVEIDSLSTNTFLIEDYVIGRLAENDFSVYESLRSKILSVPDLIQVEHPWLFGFAEKYRRESGVELPLIYSSHNVEWKLKHEMLTTFVGTDEAEQTAFLIKEMELYALDRADSVICVSQSDFEWIEQNSTSSCVIAPNGVKPWSLTESGILEAEEISRGHSYSLFCASAHPPNMTGFFNVFSGGFGSLKPDEKLIIAGGVGEPIIKDPRFSQSAKLSERTIAAGLVSQTCLVGLLESAHCVVLPITQGGGTNLKTAEALWSGKYIVATTKAMRGFEEFIDSPGVFVADTPKDFKRNLRNAMSLSPLKLSPKDIEARKSVLWASCLNPALQLISSFKRDVDVN